LIFCQFFKLKAPAYMSTVLAHANVNFDVQNVNLHVLIHVHLPVNVHVLLHLHTQVHAHVVAYVQSCTFTCIWKWRCISRCACTCSCKYSCACRWTWTWTFFKSAWNSCFCIPSMTYFKKIKKKLPLRRVVFQIFQHETPKQ
jgi:hypothetical protein